MLREICGSSLSIIVRCRAICATGAEGDYVYISTPNMLEQRARRLQEIDVKAELEVFELGQLSFAQYLIAQGLLDSRPLFQLCLGIHWAADANTASFKAMVEALPDGCN